MKQIDYHAKLIIYGLPTLSKPALKRLDDWLMNIVKELRREKDKKVFAKRYTVRLMK